MESQVQLAEDYYLANFNRLIEHAQAWYNNILHPSELEWISAYRSLDKASQCLLVRLYSRKGSLFRSDKLNYNEIPSIPLALEQLEAKGFVSLSPAISEQQLAQTLLTKTELTPLFPKRFVGQTRSLKKPQMVELLTDEPFERFNELSFVVIKLHFAEMIDLLLALFFANTHQDLTQFVLDDLGLHQFENYQLSIERRFFNHRDEVEQLLVLSKLADSYWNADRKQLEVVKQFVDAIPAVLAHPYIERKRQHLINDIARDCERLGEFETALNLFKQTSLPPSRERQARIYDKLEQNDKLSDTVTLILNQPSDMSELEIGQKLEQRLLRKQGVKIPRVAKPTYKERHLALDLSQQRVELAVKQHFENRGWQVFYSENALLNGVMGLALWDAIFAPVEGAFINAYQFKPLDLYHKDFDAKRSEQVNQALEKIAQGNHQFIIDNYHNKLGISNPFVVWSHFTEELLNLTLNALKPEILVNLIKVQLSDLKLYRNGMPDLIAFKDGQFEWIEVKGPGDKLQDNQIRWFKQFSRLGVPFSVCYVDNNPDTNRTCEAVEATRHKPKT
ncbi:nuclease [Vibrio ponticus]|uniref:phosphodiesterase I n=1 Tax=Vibrio ponticus TaxID=265668 RepID=A0ABX3F601_9VIBR|nr:VRR-NUC domain-containing protein [Vibrio ponticus]OLQ84331.1 nuclease [Vibrio ponticus]